MKHEVIGLVMVFTLLEDFIFFQFNLKFLICFLIFFLNGGPFLSPERPCLTKESCCPLGKELHFSREQGVKILTTSLRFGQ